MPLRCSLPSLPQPPQPQAAEAAEAAAEREASRDSAGSSFQSPFHRRGVGGEVANHNCGCRKSGSYLGHRCYRRLCVAVGGFGFRSAAAVILLEAKRGRLTKSLRQRLQTLAAKQLRQLLADAIPWESLDLLDAWLVAHGK